TPPAASPGSPALPPSASSPSSPPPPRSAPSAPAPAPPQSPAPPTPPPPPPWRTTPAATRSSPTSTSRPSTASSPRTSAPGDPRAPRPPRGRAGAAGEGRGAGVGEARPPARAHRRQARRRLERRRPPQGRQGLRRPPRRRRGRTARESEVLPEAGAEQAYLRGLQRHQEFFRLGQPQRRPQACRRRGQIKDAVLGGVALEDEQREKFNQIQQELEKLSEKFSENVLDATKKFEKLITDKKEIDGLPASALGLAAQTAVSKGHENASAENGPWMITLDAPSFMAVMQHAKNRALREEVYRAYLTRASSGDLDNTDIISQILKLRLEKAKLLGYKNFAEVSMARKMATVDRVQELLEKIRAASWDHAVQDMEDLKAFVKDSGSAEANDLAHWDLNFWSERLRESKYDIDEEGLRPYFALPKVMDGLFSLANKLFGITVEAADGLAPVWNSDVKFYCVKDSSNSPVAYFYFDPYSRPSEKRGGAWMNVVFSRSSVLARHGSSVRLPVAHMVCNQMPPVGDKPSLMTFREVETVFHEFGHALQHMLTRQDEAFVAGISGIEWDAVELPSQFMENWCYHKNTLLSIAKHYETGEPLPEEIYAKLVAAKNFRAGTFSLRQIRFASVDMELHTTYDPSGPVSVYDVDRRVAEKTQVLAPLPEDRFLCGFSHIFAGGYAAGYYSYKWAEVLSADAFSAFEDVGLDNEKAIEETGRRFRETVLALGGGKSPLEVFVAFRGRE
uniref:oligopeptidase A n=1 Tax=Aegilops tauschii subsp. strangulata TaxID=200361 RepID=A0A453Q7P4_AEGTS